MKKQINIKSDYNSLEKILDFVKKETAYKCSKEYDSWDVRTDANGQMEKCVVMAKGSMHGIKVFLPNENSMQMTYIIPNKLMNAYFGKSQKRYQSITQIVGGKIKELFLLNSQKKAFQEFEEVFKRIAV